MRANNPGIRRPSGRPRPQTGRRARPLALVSAAAAALLLTACGQAAPAGSSSTAGSATSDSGKQEAASATPRLVMTYDGGIMTMDAASLEVIAEEPLAGFNRLSPAGDGRHVLVSTGDAFKVYDAGAWSSKHGDHAHHYTVRPGLTSTEFAASEPGHAVRHAGATALFSDGTGRVEIFDPSGLADGKPEGRVHALEHAHHGVAVPLDDGGLLVTLGTEESRSGVAVLDADGKELARNEHCPGAHGEAVAEGAIVVGCEDGLMIYRDGKTTKVDSPDGYGRIGNQAGTEESTVVLGDYKVDPEAELERPERISLIDTATGKLRLVDLGTSYSFRSLGRGPEGEALVLGTDGFLHVIDPDSGALMNRIPVVDDWSEPLEWQEPRPALFVQGGAAYVTDPAEQKLHAVDLDTGKVASTAELPHVPNEITGISG
ncbi:zinc metallochaperone AztD [Arthrobacter mangrovi]|uniref:Secreted protein n=1 Tax=Arthrobacter mangrovi TaxID=2966350 RepID=A0ABQ5MW83_9MICC|nr:zinc metallochaperone AztD [Arthrobacter mangrovi]GLB67922.1 hypothetical protein AHIS1636_23630 [Arthrobacter mangrovi]